MAALTINDLNSALNKASQAANALQTAIAQSGSNPDLTPAVTAAIETTALIWQITKTQLDPLVVSVTPLAQAQATSAAAQASAAAGSPLAS